MKTFMILLTVLLVHPLAHGQQDMLSGTWNITDFTLTRSFAPDSLAPDSMVTFVDHQDRDRLEQDGSVWTLDLLTDSTLVQTSNMRTGEMESWEGTWSVSGDVLALNLLVDEQRIRIVYRWSFDEDMLVLARRNPMGTFIVQAVFERD